MYIRWLEYRNGEITTDLFYPLADMPELKNRITAYRKIFGNKFNPLSWVTIIQLTIALKRYRIAPNVYLEYRW